MAHFGTLRDYKFAQEAGDIRGAELYGAKDEKLGKIDDVIFDHTSGSLRYAVVDTGGWLHSKKFLVPANQIFSRPDHDDDFAVNLTKEQIERFPAYDEKAVDRPEEFRDYENKYSKEYTTSGVMHREGSTHILTPEPAEMPAGSGSGIDSTGLDLTPNRIADKFSDTGNDPNKMRMRPAGVAARAEDTARPGASAGLENVTAEETGIARKPATAASTSRESIEGLYENAPRTSLDSNDAMLAEQDRLTNPDDIYTPAAERHRRMAGFEDLLRKNRVDIAARCGSCSEKKDEAA
jgi:sporulation protein YlmC with PRC-barrel domain